MAKPWLKYAHVLAKENKKADSCTSNFDANSVALQEAGLRKKNF